MSWVRQGTCGNVHTTGGTRLVAATGLANDPRISSSLSSHLPTSKLSGVLALEGSLDKWGCATLRAAKSSISKMSWECCITGRFPEIAGSGGMKLRSQASALPLNLAAWGSCGPGALSSVRKSRSQLPLDLVGAGLEWSSAWGPSN